MKYLKSLEEKEIDQDYIEMCFIEFIDKDNFNISMNYDKTCCNISIKYNLGSPIHKISSKIRNLEQRLEILNNINNCLSKVKIRYKHIQHNIDHPTNNKVLIGLALDSSAMVIRNPRSWFTI